MTRRAFKALVVEPRAEARLLLRLALAEHLRGARIVAEVKDRTDLEDVDLLVISAESRDAAAHASDALSRDVAVVAIARDSDELPIEAVWTIRLPATLARITIALELIVKCVARRRLGTGRFDRALILAG